MFMKNRILISMILGATSLSFVGCGDTTDPNDFSMCEKIEDTDSTTNALDALSGENPVITLYGDRTIKVPVDTASILDDGDKAEAYDPQDGDLTSQIQRNNDVDLTQAGEYHIKYRVEDSDGNEDIKCRKVIVEGTNTDTNGIYDNGEYVDDGYVEDYTGGEQNNNNLGNLVGEDDSSGGYNNNYSSNSSDLDTFIAWYANTCGGTFNSSLYNESSKTYNGTIDCSNRGLTSIDLSSLSMFDGINEIDLSKNKLTDIDFSPIRNIHTLWKLNIAYNTQTLKNKYDTASERNALFRYFTNLHGGDGKTTGLWIGFKPRSGNKEDLLSIKF